jgi:hypothetical protein
MRNTVLPPVSELYRHFSAKGLPHAQRHAWFIRLIAARLRPVLFLHSQQSLNRGEIHHALADELSSLAGTWGFRGLVNYPVCYSASGMKIGFVDMVWKHEEGTAPLAAFEIEYSRKIKSIRMLNTLRHQREGVHSPLLIFIYYGRTEKLGEFLGRYDSSHSIQTIALKGPWQGSNEPGASYIPPLSSGEPAAKRNSR